MQSAPGSLPIAAAPSFSKLFPWPFRRKSRCCRPVAAETRRLQFFCVVSAATRARHRLPNAPAIEDNAKSQDRKEIVGGESRPGPEGEHNGAPANAIADRRDARNFATASYMRPIRVRIERHVLRMFIVYHMMYQNREIQVPRGRKLAKGGTKIRYRVDAGPPGDGLRTYDLESFRKGIVFHRKHK